MKSVNNHKLLVSSERDQRWGVTVDMVGSMTLAPADEESPLKESMYADLGFDVGKSRALKSYVLLYLTSGSGSFTGHDRVRREIGCGDLLLLRPGCRPAFRPNGNYVWKEYRICFEGREIDERFAGDFFDGNSEVFKVGMREDIVSLFERAIEVAAGECSSYQQYLAGIVNLLLGIAVYNHNNRHFESVDAVGQIEKARKIMRDEVYNDISPEQVAERVHMSYSWFRKMFRDYTDISPARYMQELRLREACRLLSGSTLSIKEIAERLNYGDASYFSNMFRRNLRMTPIAYRRKFGNQTHGVAEPVR